MRTIALISDIHANLPALEAVLEDIDAMQYDDIWCLGDIVGRGSHPDECWRIVRDNCTIILMGNHDAVAAGVEGPERFHGIPGLISSLEMKESTEDDLANLPSNQGLKLGNIKAYLVHAAPWDPLWAFISEPRELMIAWSYLPDEVSLLIVGHTHKAVFAQESEQGIMKWIEKPSDLAKEPFCLNDSKTMINPGAVGAGKKASWGVLTLNDEGKPVSFEYKQTAYK